MGSVFWLQAALSLLTALACLFSQSLAFSTAALSVLVLVLLGSSFVSSLLLNRRVQGLITYLMRVQDDLSLPELQSFQEGAFGILQSEIYKLVALLNEESQEAQKGRRYLTNMLSDISHQLKTPLAGITLLADLLKNPGLPAEKRAEFAEKINAQADRASWLIKNLLTLSRLEAGVLTLQKEPVSPGALLQEAVKPFEMTAELKGVRLSVGAAQGDDLLLDKKWTLEALSNLVKNCLEHTPKGGYVDLRMEQNNFSTDFIIQDNGEGIKKEQLPYLFHRFYKADNARPDSVGIGLSLARQIVLLQNGDISVESKPGKGTRFLIKLYRQNSRET